jgi:hypothetical protein
MIMTRPDAALLLRFRVLTYFRQGLLLPPRMSGTSLQQAVLRLLPSLHTDSFHHSGLTPGHDRPGVYYFFCISKLKD